MLQNNLKSYLYLSKMLNPTTVKEAFEPLNKRLLEFQNFVFFEDLDQDPHTAANSLITHVYLSVLRMEESNKIFNEANLCETDILEILKNLDQIILGQGWSKEVANERIKNCRLELNEYLFHTNLLKEKFPLKQENHNSKDSIVPLEFIPKEEGHNFKAKLSEKEAAILTHCFEELCWMPRYQKVSKGRLANYLFKRDADNVRGYFSDPTFPDSPTYLKDLVALKERIMGLSELIDKHISQAKIKKVKRL